jgi:hypothetical protein
MLLLFSQPSIETVEPIQPSIQWALGARFLGLSGLGVNLTICVYLMIVVTSPLPLRSHAVYKKEKLFELSVGFDCSTGKFHHFHYIQLTSSSLHPSSYNISIYTEFTRSPY